ncbi:hypothetical protein ATE84_1203 [Aquimarina sp. MAR_2010_214]|uniref:DUF6428 family protein n=1 Tax=Aquimarina sp. MAR_2010_214 TaxID=1250026 RepID=UPI000C7067A5|nr:DUF6428 family protein [Aquimarina sp. MAR_2010_214]PKV49186.1 hypothetical protein ATE84_1203 [Aquimarina sp. MAR_2010_214]
MNTSDFITLLAEHQDKSLLFEYAPGMLVGTNYHITEVKHVTVDAVDCGTGTDFWKETIIQLWESPNELGKPEYMSTLKALGILRKVGKMKPYEMDAVAKIEYGNTMFHTAQLHISDFEIKNDQLILKLTVNPTDCKAKEVCGITEANSEETASCAPGSGCC